MRGNFGVRSEKHKRWMKKNAARIRKIGKGNLHHGHSRMIGGRKHTPEYNAWRSAKSRCFNQNNEKYPIYGASGITMCKRWIHNFENFLADVGLRPASGYSLDRYPNPAGNYEPKNVRWATAKQQTANRRPFEPPRLKWAWERYAEAVG